MRQKSHVRICGGLGRVTSLVYPTTNWSDGKKWFMGILGALLIATIVAVATVFVNGPTQGRDPLVKVRLELEEIDVHNEWVIRVDSANSLEEARKKSGVGA